jgi:hypothetical protein
MKPKSIIFLIVAAIVAVTTIASFNGLIGKNDDQNWQVLQSVGGKITIIDNAGYYFKKFGTVTTYPRAVQEEFGRSEGESVRTTFNDGGTAEVSTMIRYQTPTLEPDRRKFHRDFSGNIANSNISVRAHLINDIKATGPLMSSTENQASRKSEFTDVILNQLRDGLYEMRRVRVATGNQDEDGKDIMVYATEIILDEKGLPKIAEASPLAEYGIQILQFSTTEIDYDEQTKAQFMTKKKSFQLAEQSKAEREQEVQQRLMIIEKGLREKAEVEAVANKEMASATINATREKIVAETRAAQVLAVAKLEKQSAETKAEQVLAVAKLTKEAASEDAEAIIILATAEEEKIAKAGAITEEVRVLAEIAAKRDVQVAEFLSQTKTPEVVIIGGGDSNGSSLTDNLVNIKLMQGAGLIKGGSNGGLVIPMN